MVHVVFDTSTVGYDDFIQSGGGGTGEASNINYGENTYAYYKGAPPFQRGYGIQGGAGIGDVLRGVWRFFLPFIRRAGTTISQEALNTGQRVLDRVINEGDSLKNAMVSEGKKGVDVVLEKGGFEKQFGSGHRRGIKRKKVAKKNAIIPTHQTIIGPPKSLAKKRVRADAFGLF